MIMDEQIQIDDTQAPIVVITYPRVGSIEIIPAAMERFREVCIKHKRVAFLVDMRAFNPITAPPKTRAKFSELYNANRSVWNAHLICEARVVPSRIVQGIIIAVDWLTTPAYPTKTFVAMTDAYAFVREHLAKEDERPSSKQTF